MAAAAAPPSAPVPPDDELLAQMDATASEARKALGADWEVLDLLNEYAPLHRFWAVRLFRDALQDLLDTLRAYERDRLFFTVCSDCKALSEKGFTPLLQALKVASVELWKDVHEIKFPLPQGAPVDLTNAFVIPLSQRVLARTVRTSRACVQLLKERVVYTGAAQHSNYLSSDPDGHVFVTSNRLGWEMWKLEEVLDSPGTFFLSSVEHDRALSCSSEGRLFTTPNRLGWERWRVEAEAGTDVVYLQSAEHGLRLSCNAEGKLSAVAGRQGWEQWRFASVVEHARQLRAQKQQQQLEQHTKP